MSAKFETGDIIKTKTPIIEGKNTGTIMRPDKVHGKPDASPYEEGFVHARTNAIGRIVDVNRSQDTVVVLFKSTGTATPLFKQFIEKANEEIYGSQ